MNHQPEAQYYAHYRDERSPEEAAAAHALVDDLIELAFDEGETCLSEGWAMSHKMHGFAETYGQAALASVLIDFAYAYDMAGGE